MSEISAYLRMVAQPRFIQPVEHSCLICQADVVMDIISSELDSGHSWALAAVVTGVPLFGCEAPDGHRYISSFSPIILVAGADAYSGQGTYPQGINEAHNGTYAFSINGRGVIAGQYYGEDSVSHGFRRDADGSMHKFDVPARRLPNSSRQHQCVGSDRRICL
jgi:hypothetical protein